MNKSTIKKLTNHYLAPVKHALGLSNWTTVIMFDLISPLDDNGLIAKAECRKDLDYRKATIRFNTPQIADKQDFLDCLVHELAHLLLAPYDLFRQVVREYFDHRQDGNEGADAIGRVWTHACELTTTQVEFVLQTALQLDWDLYAEWYWLPDPKEKFMVWLQNHKNKS